MKVVQHVTSTDKRPKHHCCSQGPESWCGFQRDQATYKHKKGLPDAVVKYIQPVFEDLADEELLKRCLHGKTQNVNENLNKLIRDRCSKEYFVDRYTVEEAAWSALSYLNDGFSSVEKTLEKRGSHSWDIVKKDVS